MRKHPPLWRWQWLYGGAVGGASSESNVPGRCRCPGEPHLADRRSPASAAAVQNARSSEAPLRKLSPGTNKEEGEWNSGKAFHPCDTVGSHKMFGLTVNPKVQRRLSEWMSAAFSLGQHVEAWLSGTQRAEKCNSAQLLFALHLFVFLSPYLLWSSQAAPSSRHHLENLRRSGRPVQRSPSEWFLHW